MPDPVPDGRLVLRDATAVDTVGIREVTLAAYQEFATAMPAIWPSYQAMILRTLEGAEPTCIVAELDGAIVGSVLLIPPGGSGGPMSGPWPEIRLLAVAPSARGRGVGSALMRACLARARATGAAAISLHTTDLMQAAMRMYKRMGFLRTPETDFEPAPGTTVKGYRLDFGPQPAPDEQRRAEP